MKSARAWCSTWFKVVGPIKQWGRNVHKGKQSRARKVRSGPVQKEFLRTQDRTLGPVQEICGRLNRTIGPPGRKSGSGSGRIRTAGRKKISIYYKVTLKALKINWKSSEPPHTFHLSKCQVTWIKRDVFAIPRKVSTLDMQYSVSTDLMTVEFQLNSVLHINMIFIEILYRQFEYNLMSMVSLPRRNWL